MRERRLDRLYGRIDANRLRIGHSVAHQHTAAGRNAPRIGCEAQDSKLIPAKCLDEFSVYLCLFLF
ncbi:MAG: hypothetical protein JWO19_4641 [Bryobacterales bacterium]|nr:hypothetical protein [Bryobacterales bacterium]